MFSLVTNDYIPIISPQIFFWLYKKYMTEDKKKALKSGELWWGSSFFSSMWFEASKEKKPVAEEKKEEKAEVNKDDLLNMSISSGGLWNAKVIRKSNATVVRSSNTPAARPPRRRNTRPQHGGKVSTHSRVSFSKGRKPRPKAAATPASTKPKKEATVSTNLKKKTEITISNMITVKEFSEKTGVPFPELMKVMISNKIIGGINTNLDYDTAALIGEELGVQVNKEQDTVSIESLIDGDLNAILDLDKESKNLATRPPIVTIMGHVDHGKTTLLDYLRKTDVVGGEAWWITQSIGASTITHQGKQITFIDTPGHELFTTMRSRGAKLTDIVIIIVAADDGIMPQTIESINHAKESGVPIIVAITKVDKPWANKQEEIKANIGSYDLIPEERGGDVPVVEISWISGLGIDTLLEHISVQAEVLELTYNPERSAVGVVLDAHKSAQQGIETSLIILTGKLKVGDVIAVHNTFGKVKRMINRAGKTIKEAHGWDPVQILWISDTPEPWRIAEWVKNEKEAAQKVAIIKERESTENKQSSLQVLLSKMESGEKTLVKLILKANGPTGLEALSHAIDSIETPENVEIKKVHMDVGQFTESDISLASASGALMIWFNVKVPATLTKKAEQQKLTLKNFDIIYELTEYMEELAMGLIEVEMHEVVIGKLDLLAVFYRKGKEMVVWWKVMEGIAKNGVEFKVRRIEEEATQIAKGTITSLQRDMQNVKEVKQGYECGMRIKVSKPVQEGDILEFVEMQEVS